MNVNETLFCLSLSDTTIMTDTIKFNSEDIPALEMPEGPREERKRQEENKEEIKNIQEKCHTSTDSKEQDMEKKEEEAPGNRLDAAGQVHVDSKPQETNNELDRGVLPEQTDPNAKVWSNDPNEPFADQWRPTALSNEPQLQDQRDTASSRRSSIASSSADKTHRSHHSAGSQTSEFNPTFESTMSDIKSIFNSSDANFEDKQPKLHNPTPLNPVQPDELIYNLQITAIKYIVVACSICYLLGRLRFGYIIGSIAIGSCAWAYVNLGRVSAGGLEWQLEKQENMKTVRIAG
jgi:hypothetical protein